MKKPQPNLSGYGAIQAFRPKPAPVFPSGRISTSAGSVGSFASRHFTPPTSSFPPVTSKSYTFHTF